MSKRQANGTPAVIEATPLSTEESADLKRHEATIDKGLGTFMEVGSALLAISEGQLYRQSHKEFESYCRDRWNLARARAYQLIDAARISNNLSTIGRQAESTHVDDPVPLPKSERQTRALARLPADQQRQAWKKAVEESPNGTPKTSAVKRAAAEVSGKPEPKAASKPKAAAKPPEPPPKPDPKAVDAVLSEQEEPEDEAEADEQHFLAQFALRERLTPRCQVLFDIEAIAYRDCSEHLVALRKIVRKALSAIPPAAPPSVFLSVIDHAIRFPHPRGGERKGKHPDSGWVGCADCLHDGKHTGKKGNGRPCEACGGRGWHVPGVRA